VEVDKLDKLGDVATWMLFKLIHTRIPSKLRLLEWCPCLSPTKAAPRISDTLTSKVPDRKSSPVLIECEYTVS
jgi:hypothetical protein